MTLAATLTCKEDSGEQDLVLESSQNGGLTWADDGPVLLIATAKVRYKSKIEVKATWGALEHLSAAIMVRAGRQQRRWRWRLRR